MNTPEYSPLTNRMPEDIIAYCRGEAITVQQFLRSARDLAERLPDHAYVLNLCEDRFEFLLCFCASVIAGQCTLLPPNKLAKTQERLTTDYPDSYVLGAPESRSDRLLSAVKLDHPVDDGDGSVPQIPENQCCAIVFTSGSTGAAEPNLKYWNTLRSGSLINAGFLFDDPAEPMNLLGTVPPQHMWGFEASILLPLFANAAVSHVTPFFPQDIADALESLPEPRGLISSPVHLRVLLMSGVSTPRLERVFSATAPLDRNLAQDIERQFNTRIVEVFGSSETGMLAFRNTSTENSWRLPESFKLEVQDDGVLIKGRHLPEPVFLQDIVEKTDDGRLRLLGRHQDMLNIAGKRGSLADLNRRLLAIPGVEDGVIFMPGNDTERLAAMIVAPGLEPTDVMRELRQEIDPVFLPRPVYMVSQLPRQETGKLTQADLVKLYTETARMKTSDRRDR